MNKKAKTSVAVVVDGPRSNLRTMNGNVMI